MKLRVLKQELSLMDVDALKGKKKEFSDNLFNLKMAVKLNKVRNTALIKKMRHLVACVNTYIVQKNKVASSLL